MKRIPLITTAALLIVLSAVSLSWSQGPGQGPGQNQDRPGWGMRDGGMNQCLDIITQLPEDKQVAVLKLITDHRASQQTNRDALRAKMEELDTLMASPQENANAIDGLVNEINTMRSEQLKNSVAFRSEFFNLTGTELPGGPRGDRGNRGNRGPRRGNMAPTSAPAN